jgi:hypothetical protein
MRTRSDGSFAKSSGRQAEAVYQRNPGMVDHAPIDGDRLPWLASQLRRRFRAARLAGRFRRVFAGLGRFSSTSGMSASSATGSTAGASANAAR